MFPKCGGYAEIVRIRQPYQYFDLLRHVREVLQQGTFRLDRGNCDLAEIRKDKPWPDDHLEHYFSCVACGQRFRLGVETYHGSGGRWEPVGPNEGVS